MTERLPFLFLRGCAPHFPLSYRPRFVP